MLRFNGKGKASGRVFRIWLGVSFLALLLGNGLLFAIAHVALSLSERPGFQIQMNHELLHTPAGLHVGDLIIRNNRPLEFVMKPPIFFAELKRASQSLPLTIRLCGDLSLATCSSAEQGDVRVPPKTNVRFSIVVEESNQKPGDLLNVYVQVRDPNGKPVNELLRSYPR